MAKYLAFFGAFNPPTVAHVDLSEYAMRAAGFDRVIFVPSKQSYIEGNQGKNFAFSDAERLDMFSRIAANRPWMEYTDIELRSETQPRTYSTLQQLRDRGICASLLLGSDKLTEFETGWKNVPEICREFGMVIMRRSNDDCEAILNSTPFLRGIRPYIQLVDTPSEYASVSSSAVRSLVLEIREAHRRLDELVPPELNGLREYL